MSLTDEQFILAMKALSEPNRLEIVRIVKLKEGQEGVTCTTVLSELDISQSTFSHHVGELREAQILIAEPQGRTVRLTVNHKLFNQLQQKIDLLK
ncbi:MAG: ArsR/SmtB family transcription factor [Fimbriimonadaceae bacterium]